MKQTWKWLVSQAAKLFASHKTAIGAALMSAALAKSPLTPAQDPLVGESRETKQETTEGGAH